MSKTYIRSISNALEFFSGLMLDKETIVYGSDFATVQINGSILTVLESQIEELKLLPGVEGTWVQYDFDDNDHNSVTELKVSILDAMKEVNLEEEGIPSSVCTQNQLDVCITSFENTLNNINSIEKLKPKTSYDYYKNAAASFESDVFIYDVKQYVAQVEQFKSDLSGAFLSSPFKVFLTLRPDVISDEFNNNIFSFEEAYTEFLNRYHLDAYFNQITFALSGLDVNVVQKITSTDFEKLEDELSFTMKEGALKINNVLPTKETSDDFIKSNHSDGSVDAVQLSYDLLTGRSSSLILNSRFGKHLGKLLFESNYWEGLKQKFSEGISNNLRMFSSNWDSTLVFWTKFNKSTDPDRIVILSFASGPNKEFKFSIRPYSYGSISMLANNGVTNNSSNNSETDTSGDSTGNLNTGQLFHPIYGNDTTKVNDQYSWVMWSIKFDNSTKYFEKGINDGPDFKHRIGLNVTTYTFEESSSINGYKIIKHDLNTFPMDDQKPLTRFYHGI